MDINLTTRGSLHTCLVSFAEVRYFHSYHFFLVKPSCGGLQDQVIAINGSSTILPCEPKGNPKPAVQWSKTNSKLPTGRYAVTNQGLAIQDVTQSDSGSYQVTLSSPAGTFAHVINLDVKSKSILSFRFDFLLTFIWALLFVFLRLIF